MARNRTFYVYILECINKRYYTGFTNNIHRRLKEHQTGLNPYCYTASRRPVELVYYKIFYNPLEGIAYEKKIKKWSHAKKRALIQNNLSLLPPLSKKKFD